MNINLNAYLRALAAKSIAATEQAAIEWYLNHGGEKLQNKSQYAIDYGMAQYAKATARIPVLAATQIDDQIVRQLLTAAIAEVWAKLDDAIKQQAREVTDNVTVTRPS